ncbi:hypothetical protein J8I87_42450 [Paraburkholderia sp. LEh10]|nr:hypothetical protein [Paraburkholderia sp. LEh10]MBP0596151.1 hypothetical protein [Paraburkholderia sp. LEh10]
MKRRTDAGLASYTSTFASITLLIRLIAEMKGAEVWCRRHTSGWVVRGRASDIASRPMSQMKPASSRAMATTAMFFCLLLAPM